MQTGNKGKFISYILIFISLFILIFFVKNYYSSLIENMDSLSSEKQEYTEKKQELTSLEEVENSLKTNSWVSNEVSKYINDFKEDELLSYFYDWVRNLRTWSWYIIINSVTFDKWSVWEYWFKEWSIILNLFVSDENQLFSLLDYLTWDNAKYKFFIDSFSFPNDPTSTSGFQITIPLKVFYK